MSAPDGNVVIVGAGHAGAQLAVALRQRRFEGAITLVGDEREPPYERPPLSKEYLAGDKPFERILIRPEGFWAERGVELALGQRVVAIDQPGKAAVLADGERIKYGVLVWAAGGAPRRLTCGGADLEGVHTIRTKRDVDRLKDELPDVQRICVIGGGYIGLEAAAVFRKLGRDVVLLEAQERLLARVAGPALSGFMTEYHRAHGVDIRLGSVVASLEGRHGRVAGVRLADGDVVACDLAIVGIGIAPSVDPLLAIGAKGGNGVLVDALCRTSVPDIFAIGDCALHPNRFAGGALVRLESVQNANDMAATAAGVLVGDPNPYDAVPWFWSNQYDLRLQTVGLAAGYDREIVRGDPTGGSFSVIYTGKGRVLAVDSVNAPKDYVQGRMLVAQGSAPEPVDLADPDVLLKSLVQL